MNEIGKNVMLWVLSIVLTLMLVVYQRATGPTYPVRGSVEIEGQTIKYRLIRSFMGDQNARIEVEVPEDSFTGKMEYRRFKSHDHWTGTDMEFQDGALIGFLPNLPPAGKMMYNVVLYRNGQAYALNAEPVILRYTGAVPQAVLVPHIFFMFISLLFGIRIGLEVLLRRRDSFFLTGVVVFTLFLGGLVLGPIVQKYAFDAYWTGWPFGHDLTDNKTIATFILWLVAWFVLRKNRQNRIWPIVAVIGMLAVYLIPHSVLGSELDFTQEPHAIEQPLIE